MHVIKIRDENGEERIYAARLVKHADDVVIFEFKGETVKVRAEALLDLVRVESAANNN